MYILYMFVHVYTDCALSQTSCLSLYDDGGQGRFQRRWGALSVHSYVKILPHYSGSIGDGGKQTSRGRSALPRGLAVANNCKTAQVCQRGVCF
jgi:hypothetical protein